MFDDAGKPQIKTPGEYTGPAMFSILPCLPSRSVSPLPRSGACSSVNSGGSGPDILEELHQAKGEIELLKSMVRMLYARSICVCSDANQRMLKDPFRAAEMAIELQVEKMRAAEAISARDSAVQRLSSAYDSIKEKAYMVNRLQGEKAELEQRLADFDNHLKEAVEQARSEERKALEDEMQHLRDVIRELRTNDIRTATVPSDSPVVSEAASASTLFSGLDDSPSFSTVIGECENVDKVGGISYAVQHLQLL